MFIAFVDGKILLCFLRFWWEKYFFIYWKLRLYTEIKTFWLYLWITGINVPGSVMNVCLLFVLCWLVYWINTRELWFITTQKTTTFMSTMFPCILDPYNCVYIYWSQIAVSENVVVTLVCLGLSNEICSTIIFSSGGLAAPIYRSPVIREESMRVMLVSFLWCLLTNCFVPSVVVVVLNIT